MITHYLVIYDISNKKRLQKIALLMEDFGIRVQYSVFEMKCEPKVIERMKLLVRKLMKIELDSVMIFPICEIDWQKQEKYGPKIFIDREPDKEFQIL